MKFNRKLRNSIDGVTIIIESDKTLIPNWVYNHDNSEGFHVRFDKMLSEIKKVLYFMEPIHKTEIKRIINSFPEKSFKILNNKYKRDYLILKNIMNRMIFIIDSYCDNNKYSSYEKFRITKILPVTDYTDEDVINNIVEIGTHIIGINEPIYSKEMKKILNNIDDNYLIYLSRRIKQYKESGVLMENQMKTLYDKILILTKIYE